MPSRSKTRSAIQLLVEGADTKYFFMHMLGHMGFNNVDVQDDVEWRGSSRVYHEAMDLIDGLGLTGSLDECDVAAFNRVRKAILTRLDPSDIEIRDFGGNEELPDFLSDFINAVQNAPGARSNLEAIGIVRDAESNSVDAFQYVRKAISKLKLTPPDCPMQIVGENPRIGVLILPPNKDNGMLEDICLDAVQADPATPCVEEYIECLKENLPEWQDGNRRKATVQAFLASRPEPGMKLGEGAKLGYWNWSHEAYRPIEQFIRELSDL